MSSSSTIAPAEEQKICLTCGFCCDRTLFLFAHLNKGERGHLPEKIDQNSYSKNGKDYFRQPCLYFSGKCTIYGMKRADVCSSYRCQLLKDVAEGKISLVDALAVIRGARRMRTDLFNKYQKISGIEEAINFRQLLVEIGKIQKSDSVETHDNSGLETLVARCNIFEALLIRHFRSAADFEKIMQ
jgi:hypothetical protein